MSKTPSDYTQLQSSIDKVIGKIGLQRTVFLLENFTNNLTVRVGEQEKIKLVNQFLINLAIHVFELEAELFFLSDVREYRDARMCCYHLLRKYTGDTFARIGLAFQCSQRAVSYGYAVAGERLEMPKGHPVFASKYTLLESHIIEFIGKLN